jgi:hypothetical protein
MTKLRITLVLAITLITAAIASVLTYAGAASAGSRPPGTVVIDCPGYSPQTEVKPSTYILTCQNGDDYIDHLSWTSWTPAMATAAGTQEINDCLPSCAAGHHLRYPVLLILWASAAVPGHPGEHQYTTMTALYPGTRPGGQAVQTGPLTASPPIG